MMAAGVTALRGVIQCRLVGKKSAWEACAGAVTTAFQAQ
jgi:hypothetical protein